MVIFNWLAALEIVVSLLIGFLVNKFFSLFGIQGTASDMIFIVTIAISLGIIDFVLRLRKIQSTDGELHELIYPNRGGHLMFIPVFILGIVWLIYGIAKALGA